MFGKQEPKVPAMKSFNLPTELLAALAWECFAEDVDLPPPHSDDWSSFSHHPSLASPHC